MRAIGWLLAAVGQAALDLTRWLLTLCWQGPRWAWTELRAGAAEYHRVDVGNDERRSRIARWESRQQHESEPL